MFDHILKDAEKEFDKIMKEEPCLWDGMPETSPGSGIKIGSLSCPCPKCSPTCSVAV